METSMRNQEIRCAVTANWWQYRRRREFQQWKPHITNLIIVSMILVNCISSLGDSKEDTTSNDLYTEKDDVIRLNATSFIPTVFHTNKNTTFIVQFYNSFCGHCQMFAPIYKEVATRIKNWSPLVKMAGVDCSKDENIPTCSENNISGYPTILVFPPNAAAQDPNDPPTNFRDLKTQWDIDGLEEGIIEYLTKLTKDRKNVPNILQALYPIAESDPNELKSIHSEKIDGQTRDMMFIIEQDNSYLGRKLILEFSSLDHKLELRTVFSNNTAFIKLLAPPVNIDELDKFLPILVRYTENDFGSRKIVNQLLLKGSDVIFSPKEEEIDHEDRMYNKFKQFLEGYYSIELEILNKNNNSIHNNLVEVNGPQKKTFHRETAQMKDSTYPDGKMKVYSVDIIKSIRYIFHHEIQARGDIAPNEYLIIKNLLAVFLKFLPIAQWSEVTSNFLNALNSRLSVNNSRFEKAGLAHNELVAILTDIEKDPSSNVSADANDWISCSESENLHKGYPCSLWLTFHTLTVSEFMKAPPAWGNLHSVLYIMRDYIITFFGCSECATNFKMESASLEKQLSQRNSSVIWLWMTHNRINARLNNEKQMNKRKPIEEVIYPSVFDCPKCYLDTKDAPYIPNKGLNDIRWDIKEIFKFILNRYRPDHVQREFIGKNSDTKFVGHRAAKSLELIRDHHNDRLDDSELKVSNGDISLCLLLYLICISIVGLVCVGLNPRCRRSYLKSSRSIFVV